MANKSQSFRDVVVWQSPRVHPRDLSGLGTISKARVVCPHLPTSPLGLQHPRKLRRGFPQAHYNIAQGFADECLYHLILAHDLNYADTTRLQADLEEVSRLLQGYINGFDRATG